MFTSTFRPRTALWTAALLLALSAGCGGEGAPQSPDGPQIKALRFAGVDLVYALERIAAEAGLLLALDEITPRDMSPDLELYRVDVDLPAGSVTSALRELRRTAGGFDFELHEGIVYVRSQLTVNTPTPIDLPALAAGKFEGDMAALIRLIASNLPSSYITEQKVYGGPLPVKVAFEVKDKSSIKEVFLQYARAAKLGWVLRRAGHVVEKTEKGFAVMSTSIELRPPRATPSRLPQVYMKVSTIGALADLSARLQQPLLVLDRSVLFTLRGMLNFSMQIDPPYELEPSLKALSESGWGADRYHFKYKHVDGIPLLKSFHFLYYLRGRDLLRAELLAGDFEGSLPELARWINTHQKNPTGEVLMGGEILDGLPRGRVQVRSGMTVEQALLEFAKSARVSPYVVVLDLVNPLTGKMSTHPNAWRGAFLQDLAEWKPAPGDKLIGDYAPAPSK